MWSFFSVIFELESNLSLPIHLKDLLAIRMDSKGQNNNKVHCYPIHEDPEISTNKERKLPKTNEAEEFFTVVHRIHALNRFVRKKRMHFTSTVNVKYPWKPVFHEIIGNMFLFNRGLIQE